MDSETLGDEVGSEELEPSAAELEEVESSYRVEYFGGPKLSKEYRNVVVAPFLNSLRYGNELFKIIDKEAYYSSYARYIESLLLRPMTIIKMALLKDNTVLGWAMIEYKTLHYVWVKKEVRRQGIGRALLPNDFDTITHVTNVGLNIWVSKYPEKVFNPFK